MPLNDKEIYNYLGNKIIIDPIPKNLQPCSVDLTLGNDFKRFKKGLNTIIDPEYPPSEEYYESCNRNYYILKPGEFILGTTKEIVAIAKDISAVVEGKSTLGRLGLVVHITAGFIDAGFNGKITLELKNLGDYPIILKSGMKICQIVFEEMNEECERGYGSCGNHYQGQNSTQIAR